MIRDLVRRQQRVQRHDGAADVGGAEVGDRELRRVRQQQRDVLTARKTELAQRAGETLHCVVQGGIGPRALAEHERFSSWSCR